MFQLKKEVDFLFVQAHDIPNLNIELERAFGVINNSHYHYFRNVEYQVTATDEGVLHSVVIWYAKDDEDERKERKYPSKYSKDTIDYEMVFGDSKEEFEGSLDRQREKLNRGGTTEKIYHDFQYRTVVVDGEVKHFGIIICKNKTRGK